MAGRDRLGVGAGADGGAAVHGAGTAARSRRDAGKTLLDALLAILLLLQMARHFFEPVVHEACGIALGVLVVVHLVVNRRWFSLLAKGRWNALRVVHAVVNVAMLLLVVATVLSGIGVSGVIPGFSDVLRPSAMRGAHMVCVYGMLLLFSLHLGMQWARVMARCRRALGAYTAPRGLRLALRVVALALAAGGAYELASLGLLDYITLRTRFAFIDTSQPVIPYLAQYALVMALCAWLGHYLCALLTACARRRRGQGPAPR